MDISAVDFASLDSDQIEALGKRLEQEKIDRQKRRIDELFSRVSDATVDELGQLKARIDRHLNDLKMKQGLEIMQSSASMFVPRTR